MQRACKDGDIKTAERILLENPELANWRNGVPLMLAAKYDHKELVLLLLRKGANLYSRVCAAMRAAIRRNNRDILELLFSRSDMDRVIRLASFNGYSCLVQEALYYLPFAARQIHYGYKPEIIRIYFQAGDNESILEALMDFTEDQADQISAFKITRKRPAW